MFGINKTIQLILGIIILLAFLITGMFIYQNFFSSNSETTVETKFDSVAILEEVRSQAKLQTASQTLERNVEIEIRQSDLNAFGFTLLESSYSSEIFVVGTVNAGVDLEKIDSNDIVIDQEKEVLELKIPSSEIISVEISGDRSQLIKENMSFLFNIQTIIGGNRRELDNQLFQESTKQSQIALAQASCEANILDIANQEAQEVLESLLADFDFQEILITSKEDSETCQYNPAI